MPRRIPAKPAIRDIRFTRRIARQCARGDPVVPDWAVCDAIANGTMQPTGWRGSRGGAIVRFERTLRLPGPGGPAPGPRPTTVAVAAELVPSGCIALHLLAPLGVRGKISDQSDF
jgi:hypothetical protein